MHNASNIRSLVRYTEIVKKNAFSLIELLMVLAIIGILSVVVVTTLRKATDSAGGVTTGNVKSQLNRAAQLYELDMGFYPPDVNRGWDPGFERAMPWNPDIENGETIPGWARTSDANCDHCPGDWQDLIASNWNGPYVSWPQATPWGGRYDYNYWPNGKTRPNSCVVSPGIYAGAQTYYGDSSGRTSVPDRAERYMIEIGIDDDKCINGESQLLLFGLGSD